MFPSEEITLFILHFNRIAGLSEDDIPSYAEEMKENISEFIHTPSAIKQWKEHYHSFLVPQMYIFTGEIGRLAQEMSPFFASYQHNSTTACGYVYKWLLSKEGQTLYQEIFSYLEGYINLAAYNHAGLESMNTIFKY